MYRDEDADITLESLTVMTGKEILRKLNNRYVYTTLVFLVIILFIDQFNLFEQSRLSKLLKDKHQQVNYFEQEVPRLKQQLEKTQNDTATWERIGREDYLMKRDNEVVYIIETQE